MADRQKRLLSLIEQATGRAAYIGDVPEEGEDVDLDEDTVETELTIAVEWLMMGSTIVTISGTSRESNWRLPVVADFVVSL